MKSFYPNVSSWLLAEIFGILPEGEHVVVGVMPLGTERWFQYAYTPHPDFDAAVVADAWYFCGTTSVAVPDSRARITRKDSDLHRTFVIVADDVGTKIDDSLVASSLPSPSYVLETSRGNFQLGWILEEPVSADIAGAFYRGMKSCGLTDLASAKPGQPFRLPGSKHRTGWSAEIKRWNSRVSWDEMTRHVPLVEAKKMDGTDVGWGDYLPGNEQSDVIYQELRRRGLVVRLKPDGWADIICPGWRSHTNGNQIAGYRVGGGFNCFHSHCADRDWSDLVSWLERTAK